MTSSGTGDTPTAPKAADVIADVLSELDVPFHRLNASVVFESLLLAVPGDGPLCIVDGRLVRAEHARLADFYDEAVQLWRISGTGQ